MVWGLKVALGSGFDGTVCFFSILFSLEFLQYVCVLFKKRKKTKTGVFFVHVQT